MFIIVYGLGEILVSLLSISIYVTCMLMARHHTNVVYAKSP